MQQCCSQPENREPMPHQGPGKSWRCKICNCTHRQVPRSDRPWDDIREWARTTGITDETAEQLSDVQRAATLKLLDDLAGARMYCSSISPDSVGDLILRLHRLCQGLQSSAGIQFIVRGAPPKEESK